MYESFFGLISKPFQLSPDPQFFFSSKGHKRALSYLQYGLSQGEGFIVITGDVGTGKTTLMRNLLANVHRENIIAAQLVTTKLDADDLLRMICSSFGLPVEERSKAVLLQQFQDFLRSAHQAHKRVLLVVDEAQNLPASAIEELRMLSNFQLTDAPLLQSFLLGQPELRAIVQAPAMEQFRQRIIASCHLKPLDADEVKEYILWRLSIAGWTQNPQFAESAFSHIYRHTAGVPRRINIFCDRLLLFAFLEEVPEIDESVVNAVADELAEEFSSPTTQRGSVVQAEAPPRQQEIQALEAQCAQLNRHLTELLNEKVELMRLVDGKLKGKLKQLINEK
ncbi:XrtA/PEP-CTERM system-associated ATPase [Motiliproteus sp. SC1-56]|uniref:XrtA/PEP-CTERM system-associated ATPase n=1 Tax=Motiliproteus sp. SC1-56 TaxID=2799565 RepID=UPI001A8D5D65|nr:XrtA/PEP-CTERM system-associated ATPase [Motiliproteus sp. SC1-56]